MKTCIFRAALATSAFLFFGLGSVFGQPKGDKITVKGEIVDLWCYLEGGDHGAEHKTCGTACAKAGNPIGLVTEKGEIFVMMGNEDHQPGKAVLIEQMAETVIIEGTLVKKGGTQVIYVSTVKKLIP